DIRAIFRKKPQRHKGHKEFFLIFVIFVSLWSFLLLLRGERFGLAIDQLDYCHLGAIAATVTDLDDTRITARTGLKAFGHIIKKLSDSSHACSRFGWLLLAAHIAHAARVAGVEICACQSAGMQCAGLAESYRLLYKGTQLLGLGQRCYQPLM